jgi:hypothetical protein
MKHINEAYYGRIIPQLFCYKRGPHTKNSKKSFAESFLLHIFATDLLAKQCRLFFGLAKFWKNLQGSKE